MITYEDAMKKAVNPEELKKMIFGSSEEAAAAGAQGQGAPPQRTARR